MQDTIVTNNQLEIKETSAQDTTVKNNQLVMKENSARDTIVKKYLTKTKKEHCT